MLLFSSVKSFSSCKLDVSYLLGSLNSILNLDPLEPFVIALQLKLERALIPLQHKLSQLIQSSLLAGS
jgi:hypothetical protein